ncbi:hypothetical protein DSO57_1037125 [Entomophthora muscae]|uniref:Uncharacterized protein n=1 Tax=Entomophthora muscae TaxID=34485 RepID=A0ACC2U842_9FUNG|nr:hypothetical protein DSO57_1037125 [Entomophthora muscae]
MVLFTTYDQLHPRLLHTYPLSAPYLAGGLAGLAQSFIATPFDSVKTRMETQQLLDGKHRSMSLYYKRVFKKLGVSGAYRGLAFTSFKDSLGFAVFFGVFESSKRTISSLYPIETQEYRDSNRWSTTIRNSSTTILSGMSAGLAFQTLDYPLEKVRTMLLIRAGRMELKRPYVTKLYSKTFKQVYSLIRIDGISFFFKGLSTSLYKAVPATAFGFACYEGLRNSLD